MKEEIFKFKFFDMTVSTRKSAVYGSLGILIVLTIIAILFTNLTILDAIITGIIGMLLHWLGELVHQFGHFFAAKKVKHPANGVILWWVLARTVYPRDEGTLAPQIHIQRALGGPIASLILSLVVTLLSLFWLLSYSEFSRFIAIVTMIDYWGVFTIGALFPPIIIGSFSNDGGTIWTNLRKKSPRDITKTV